MTTFTEEAKHKRVTGFERPLEAGWSGFEIGEKTPLTDIAGTNELVEHAERPGRVLAVLWTIRLFQDTERVKNVRSR